MKEPLKAFGYVRTSTSDQLNRSGPDRQADRIRACAAALGLEVAQIFIDDVSGAIDCLYRPEFKRMMDLMLADGVRTFLVEDLTRLARAVRVQEQILAYLCLREIELINATTHENVTVAFQNDPDKKAMLQMFSVFSEWERNRVVARCQAGRKRTGRYGGRPATYPDSLKTRVRRWYDQGRTWTWIADRLNRENIKTSTGRPWYPQQVRAIVSALSRSTKTTVVTTKREEQKS